MSFSASLRPKSPKTPSGQRFSSTSHVYDLEMTKVVALVAFAVVATGCGGGGRGDPAASSHTESDASSAKLLFCAHVESSPDPQLVWGDQCGFAASCDSFARTITGWD